MDGFQFQCVSLLNKCSQIKHSFKTYARVGQLQHLAHLFIFIYALMINHNLHHQSLAMNVTYTNFFGIQN